MFSRRTHDFAAYVECQRIPSSYDSNDFFRHFLCFSRWFLKVQMIDEQRQNRGHEKQNSIKLLWKSGTRVWKSRLCHGLHESDKKWWSKWSFKQFDVNFFICRGRLLGLSLFSESRTFVNFQFLVQAIRYNFLHFQGEFASFVICIF